MNLGMLLAWEQVYLMDVKNTSRFNTEREMFMYLMDEKGISQTQIRMAFKIREYAKNNFNQEQWDEVEELFAILNEGRSKGDFDSIMESLGKVLWDMGELFNMNAYSM